MAWRVQWGLGLTRGVRNDPPPCFDSGGERPWTGGDEQMK